MIKIDMGVRDTKLRIVIIAGLDSDPHILARFRYPSDAISFVEKSGMETDLKIYVDATDRLVPLDGGRILLAQSA